MRNIPAICVGSTNAAGSSDVAGQCLVDGPGRCGLPFQTDAAGQVALRVHVDEQDLLFRQGEGGREVDGGGGLPDAAFLIGDGQDAGSHYVICPTIL